MRKKEAIAREGQDERERWLEATFAPHLPRPVLWGAIALLLACGLALAASRLPQDLGPWSPPVLEDVAMLHWGWRVMFKEPVGDVVALHLGAGDWTGEWRWDEEEGFYWIWTVEWTDGPGTFWIERVGGVMEQWICYEDEQVYDFWNRVTHKFVQGREHDPDVY